MMWIVFLCEPFNFPMINVIRVPRFCQYGFTYVYLCENVCFYSQGQVPVPQQTWIGYVVSMINA